MGEKRGEVDNVAEDLLAACDEMIKALRYRRHALYIAIVVIVGLLIILWSMSGRCGV